MASMMLYTQIRNRTANFFVRRTGTELYKTATGFSMAGLKKGQGRGNKSAIRGVNRFYYIGASPLKVQYPGLNKPLLTRKGRPMVDGKEPVAITQQSDEQLKKNAVAIRNYFMSKQDSGVKKQYLIRRLKYAYQSPLDRGFCGFKMEGVLLGRPPFYGRNFKDFQCTILKVRKVCHMTRVGRKYTVQALVFIGNGQGIGGYAVGKSPMIKPHHAIFDGFKRACRKLFFIERLNDHTVYHDFYAECNYTKMFVQRQYQGHGITCHPHLDVICRLLGIKDIYIKVTGGKRNYLALCHAFVTGLLNQETHRDLAERAGMHVVKLDPARNYYPEIVCSPLNTPMKKEEDLTLQERLRLDDFYGEGRSPFKKYDKWAQIRYRQRPFRDMYSTPMLYKAWPYRNMEKVMIRLLADETLPRWTRDARKLIGDVQHEEAMKGLRPIPRGIGIGWPLLPGKGK